MNKEYWQRKADLCQKIGIEQLIEGDIKNGTRNLKRMVRALEEINLINANEGENCSTCGKEKDQFSKEWEYSQCESCSMKEGEDKSASDMWASLIASGTILTREGENNG